MLVETGCFGQLRFYLQPEIHRNSEWPSRTGILPRALAARSHEGDQVRFLPELFVGDAICHHLKIGDSAILGGRLSHLLADVRTWFVHANWQFLLALAVAVFSVLSYILTRRRDLAWRRTEFLFKQAEYLESDNVLVEMLMILEERHPTLTIKSLFGPDNQMDLSKRQEYIQRLDKLLNLLWRLCYAYLGTKTLSVKELEAFSWYLWLISESSQLSQYCADNGFEEINITITRLKKTWKLG
jgi:hypothetical protein